jgi:hypothetical protein
MSLFNKNDFNRDEFLCSCGDVHLMVNQEKKELALFHYGVFTVEDFFRLCDMKGQMQ